MGHKKFPPNAVMVVEKEAAWSPELPWEQEVGHQTAAPGTALAPLSAAGS